MRHHIELYITINDSGKPYKCDVINRREIWQCTIYQENFRYEIIKETDLSTCFAKIADFLDSLGYVSGIEGSEGSDMYISILQSRLRINSSDRTLNKSKGQELA